MTIQPNKRCHLCHKPIADGLKFCPTPKPGEDSCEVKYALRYARQKETREARRRAENGNFVPQRKSTKELIDGVILKAYRNGTLLNNFERMQIERQLQS